LRINGFLVERDGARHVMNVTRTFHIDNGTMALIVASEVKKALGPFAVLLALMASPAFAGVPALNVQKICKTRAVDAKMLKSTPAQTLEDCVKDEEAAKQQLNVLWASTSVQSRNQCESEGRSLGTTSYLDLLTCIQIVEEMKADAQKKTDKK
jgi:hypothetical protein